MGQRDYLCQHKAGWATGRQWARALAACTQGIHQAEGRGRKGRSTYPAAAAPVVTSASQPAALCSSAYISVIPLLLLPHLSPISYFPFSGTATFSAQQLPPPLAPPAALFSSPYPFTPAHYLAHLPAHASSHSTSPSPPTPLPTPTPSCSTPPLLHLSLSLSPLVHKAAGQLSVPARCKSLALWLPTAPKSWPSVSR